MILRTKRKFGRSDNRIQKQSLFRRLNIISLKSIIIPLCFILCMPLVAFADPPLFPEGYKVKIKAKKILNPPFKISIEEGTFTEDVTDKMFEDVSYSPVKMMEEIDFDIYGDCEEKSVTDKWRWNVILTHRYVMDKANNEIYNMFSGFINFGGFYEGLGTTKANLRDLLKERKEAQRKIERLKIQGDYEEGDIFVPDIYFRDADPEVPESGVALPPKIIYRATFPIKLEGVWKTEQDLDVSLSDVKSSDYVFGVEGDLASIVDNKNTTLSASVDLTVDSANKVEAYVIYQGKRYGPFKGTFTCEEELKTEIKATKAFPIWDTWTNVDQFSLAPKVINDYTKVQESIAKDEKPKTIKYTEGKWLTLIKNKKKIALVLNQYKEVIENPNMYELVCVEKDRVLYEKGMFYFTNEGLILSTYEKYEFSADLTKRIDLPFEKIEYLNFFEENYDIFSIAYKEFTDTLDVNGSSFFPMTETLVRVNKYDLYGKWSNVAIEAIPEVKKDRSTPGIWYQFTRNNSVDSASVLNATFEFKRFVVNDDKTAQIDTGLASVDYFAGYSDYELISFEVLTSETIDSDGNVNTTVYEKGSDESREVIYPVVLSVHELNYAEKIEAEKIQEAQNAADALKEAGFVVPEDSQSKLKKKKYIELDYMTFFRL